MTHPFMAAVSAGLVSRNVATLRYQFPSMELGRKRPDTPAAAHGTVRAAVAAATTLMPGLPLLAAGKSFGGRMTSQAQAEAPLPGIRGLVFFGFPLHPPKKPGVARAKHLAEVRVPMLFVHGDRDALGELELMAPLVESLGPLATLELVPGADHAFHVPARAGRTDDQALDKALGAVAAWMLLYALA